MRVVRRRRTRSARSRLQKLVGKARKGFFDSLGAAPLGAAPFVCAVLISPAREAAEAAVALAVLAALIGFSYIASGIWWKW